MAGARRKGAVGRERRGGGGLLAGGGRGRFLPAAGAQISMPCNLYHRHLGPEKEGADALAVWSAAGINVGGESRTRQSGFFH
jgi:hypothetical protein